MISIFEYEDFREWVRAWLKAQPKQGHGLMGQIAKRLRVSSVLVSQVFSGQRELKAEHAFALAEFLNLSPIELEYFLRLVEISKAGTEDYRLHLSKSLNLLRQQSQPLKSRLKPDAELSDEARARFYSHWSYSAIRLLTDIPDYQDIASIAERLRLPVAWVRDVLGFLVHYGLCDFNGDRYQMRAKSTHLEADSPWFVNRQTHWRQQAQKALEFAPSEALFYSGPMIISDADAEWVRERLVGLIKEVTARAVVSKSEDLHCLNLDWFRVGQR